MESSCIDPDRSSLRHRVRYGHEASRRTVQELRRSSEATRTVYPKSSVSSDREASSTILWVCPCEILANWLLCAVLNFENKKEDRFTFIDISDPVRLGAPAVVPGNPGVDRPTAGTDRASMTGRSGQIRQVATAEVRLDQGKATGSDLAGRHPGGLAANEGGAIKFHCSGTARGEDQAQWARNPGGCRLRRILHTVGVKTLTCVNYQLEHDRVRLKHTRH